MSPLTATNSLLTPAETKVLGLIAHALSRDEIADAMNIAPATAGKHETNLYTKLGVQSRTQAALWAWRSGLVSIDEAWAVVVERQGLHYDG